MSSTEYVFLPYQVTSSREIFLNFLVSEAWVVVARAGEPNNITLTHDSRERVYNRLGGLSHDKLYTSRLHKDKYTFYIFTIYM